MKELKDRFERDPAYKVFYEANIERKGNPLNLIDWKPLAQNQYQDINDVELFIIHGRNEKTDGQPSLNYEEYTQA